MKAELPPGSRAQKVQFARDLKRQHDLERSRVRLTRTKRRVAVTGLYLVVLATAGWVGALAANVVWGNKAIGIVYFLVAVQAIFFAILLYAVGGLTRGNASLDERQRLQRDRAYAYAYRILMVMLGLVSFGAIIANTSFGWMPIVNRAVGMTPFLVPLIWFAASLPMAVMAWILPDDVEPEA